MKKIIRLTLFVSVICAMFTMTSCSYNSMVSAEENTESAWSEVQNQYQRRADLVPNLVNTVKGYAAHEKEVFERVTEARTAAMNATSINDKIAAEKELSNAMVNLKAVAEAYPDLKANQNFMQLQTEISDIENKLAAVRRFFNSATKELNNGVQKFPAVIIANMFGFHKEPIFDVGETELVNMDKAPEINF